MNYLVVKDSVVVNTIVIEDLAEVEPLRVALEADELLKRDKYANNPQPGWIYNSGSDTFSPV